MCVLRCELRENLAPQIIQWKGFSPVYVGSCHFKLEFFINLSSLISSIKGFSPVYNSQISLFYNLSFS